MPKVAELRLPGTGRVPKGGSLPTARLTFDDQDPRVKQRREEEERRRHQEYEQGLREITAREDRLLAQIEDQQRLVEKRLKDIDDRAIKLHDGRSSSAISR